MQEVEVSEKQNVHNSLNDVLKEHMASNIDSVPFRDQQLVPIRRKEIWKDALRCINAPNFISNHGLKIRFVGEEAVDAGGPLRYDKQRIVINPRCACSVRVAVAGSVCMCVGPFNISPLEHLFVLHTQQATKVIKGGFL